MEIRHAFVLKVYSILACQLGLTCLLSGLYMSSVSIKRWAQENSWIVLLSVILTFILLICLLIYRKSHPYNMYLLSAFTLFESHAIATTTTFYESKVVLQASIITFMLFVGLSLFALQTKYDFSGLQPYLFGGLWVIILVSLVQIFLPFSSVFQFWMALFSALLFCGYILFDTQQIFKRLSPEEYIIASVELYLDILNLFLAILRLLDNRD